MDTPTAPGPLDLQWSFGLAKRPDGKHWIMVSIATLINNYQFTIPPETAAQLADQLPGLLGTLIKDANRANMGLVVTSEMPKNGSGK